MRVRVWIARCAACWVRPSEACCEFACQAAVKMRMYLVVGATAFATAAAFDSGIVQRAKSSELTVDLASCAGAGGRALARREAR